jgi:hypothetical protein
MYVHARLHNVKHCLLDLIILLKLHFQNAKYED